MNGVVGVEEHTELRTEWKDVEVDCKGGKRKYPELKMSLMKLGVRETIKM